MKLKPFILTIYLTLFCFNISFAFDDTMEFSSDHKFRETEIWQYDKCSNFEGKSSPCFTIYDLKGEEIAGACIENEKLYCKNFKEGKKYKVTFETDINRHDMDFDYSGLFGKVTIIDIKQAN